MVALGHETDDEGPARSLSQDEAVPLGRSRGLEAAHDPLRGVRQPARQAARLPARRPGRRYRTVLPPLLRSEEVAHRAARPARLRQEHALLGAQGEHDLESRGGHREAARAPRHRPVGGVRRKLGQHPVAGLRRDAPGSLQGARAARHLPPPPERAPLVLPGGGERDLSRRVGALPRADPRSRAGRHDEGLLQAPHQPRPPRAPDRPRAPGRSGRGARASSSSTRRS